eukprot:Tbor_TRINITY_DN8348_c0_g1::TRINITY_DN8348_c0_g1_i1::g.21107::m.21107
MSCPSDFEDEVEMVLSMYGDEIVCGIDQNNATTLECNLTAKTRVRIRIPRFGYPVEVKPTLQVIEAPNVSYQMALQFLLDKRIAEEIELAIPALGLIIAMAREESEASECRFEREVNERIEKENEERKKTQSILEERQFQNTGAHSPIVTTSGISILRGEIISDRKSKFLAHIARVSSIKEVEEVVSEIRSNKWIASAHHPSIYAYRFIDSKGILSQDSEDDGETAASKKILFIMEKCNVVGYVVIVTRWFGGILLGPDRFKHIMGCAKQALMEHDII